MSKDCIEMEGVVTDCLPNATFRIKVENGNHETTILGHLSGKMRINNINILAGDKVRLEVSPYDLTKGRITYRFKE